MIDWKFLLKELISEVEKMRTSQKQWFSSNPRDYRFLNSSKKYEKKVDETIYDIKVKLQEVI